MEILVTFFSAPSVDILLTRDTRDTRDMLVQIGVYNIDIQLQQPLQKKLRPKTASVGFFVGLVRPTSGSNQSFRMFLSPCSQVSPVCPSGRPLL